MVPCPSDHLGHVGHWSLYVPLIAALDLNRSEASSVFMLNQCLIAANYAAFLCRKIVGEYVIPAQEGVFMDGEPQPAARSLPPAPGSPAPQSPENPESLEPTPAAEIFIVLIPGNSTEGQQDIAEWTGSRRLAWLRRLGPKAFGVGISVPPAQASQLLRVFERVALAGMWQATVIGSLVGAAAAHLPPAGTTVVVVLEIVTPPVLLCMRQRRKGK